MAPRRDLIQVVLKLSCCRSLDEIVEVLRESTRDLVRADGISIVLRDGDKCFYCEENAVGPLWKGKRFPMSVCISGWCMIHREQVAIPDIYLDARIPHDAYRPTFVKSLAMTPIRSANPIGSIGAYWATKRQPTQEELETLQALGDSAAMALENSQLIDALKGESKRKDAYLSMLAHELRNPLAPIRNGLHLLRLQGGKREIVEQAAAMMDRQVVHMTRIVDDLLDVARINNGKVTLTRDKLDLTSLVRECVEDRRHDIEAAGLTLGLDVATAPIWIEGDPTRLTQVIGNVLENARKYTPSGGKVLVSATMDGDGMAKVIVRDTGVGIAPQKLPHIFETFMQADDSLDRTAGGLGLGLAVASGLMKMHHGTITANSDGLGQGACFTIALPGMQTVAGTQLADGQLTPTPGASQMKLLIIEDNKDSAHTLQTILEVCGYGTSVAYDGSAGVDKARAEKPDVILCDIGLPQMDGYEVASTLKQSSDTAKMRIIAVTGYGSDEDRARSAKAGFDAHLTKPVNIDELLLHIGPANADERRRAIA